MIIYVDVIFFENLVLDFIILLATGIICNCKIKIWRLIIASAIGSFCTIISFIIGISEFILKIVMSFIIILVSFGFKSKKRLVKNLGVFYLTSITFGGSSFMFLFLVNPKEIIYKAGHFFGLYPVKMAIIRWDIWFLLNCICTKKFEKKVYEIL